MPAVFIELPKAELKFYLFDDEVDDKIVSKLKKLGLADISVEYPLDPSAEFVQGGDGLYRSCGLPTGRFPITAPTATSNFGTNFDSKDNSVTVSMEGRFFCFNILEEGLPTGADRSVGFVFATRLRNDKGKLIKKSKDEWGMTSPIEALAEKGVYGGGAHKVSFSIHVEDETFYG
jgi:hypothetical protein